MDPVRTAASSSGVSRTEAELSASRAQWVVLAVVSMVAVGPLVADEGVNLSRYGAVGDLSGTTGQQFVNIDAVKVEDWCGDHDGCLMTLKVDGPNAIEVSSQRVYLSAYNKKFKTSADVATHTDGAATGVDFLVRVDYTNVSCRVSDVDDFISLEDTGAGFSLYFAVTALDAASICVLHIDD